MIVAGIFPVTVAWIRTTGGCKLRRKMKLNQSSTEDCAMAFQLYIENLDIQLEIVHLYFHQQSIN